MVVKVYGPERPGLEQEAEVCRRVGHHPAFPQCLHVGAGYLALRRLQGTTLYDWLRHGIPIPDQVIDEVDAALAYAMARGLIDVGVLLDRLDAGSMHSQKRGRRHDDLRMLTPALAREGV